MLLISVAWGSGLVYLIVRLGVAAPVRVALVDGVHAYVGLVGALLVIGKVVTVRIKRRAHATIVDVNAEAT